MKPLHIVIFVLAGALGGAALMKVVQRPRLRPMAAVPAPVAARVETSAPAPAEVVAAPAEAVAAPAPSPQAVIRQPRPSPFRKPAGAVTEPPVPPVAGPPMAAVAAEAPELPQPPAVDPQPVPPAQAENATLPPSAPPPHMVTLNAGLLIPVRLVDGLSSERNAPGDPFTATLDKELVVDGFVIAERGARVEGRVVASDRGGKVKGVAGLAVELTHLSTSDGQSVAIATDSFERHADSTQREDAEKVGAGAALGAIIGAMAGGGKGAAIGAGVGGGAGAGDVLLTRGKPATLPSETRLTFRLSKPVTLTERRG